MTCKDNCLHYEVCLTAFSSKGMYLGDDAEKMECFKNKADFADVVRCKDCKHYSGGRFCFHFTDTVLADDYCSYGERSDT